MELTKVQRGLIAGGLGVAVVVVGVVCARRYGAPGSERMILENVAPATVAPVGGQPSGAIAIHVVGGVRNPGVYKLPAGSRVQDAVAAAGGVLPGVRAEWINLAAPLEDGQQVYVPVSGPSAQEVPIPRPVVVPDPSVPGAVPQISSAPAVETQAGARAATGSVAVPKQGTPVPATAGGIRTAAASAQPTTRPTGVQTRSPRRVSPQGGIRFPVNVNTATERELEALPHIGPALSARIIQYRNSQGPFHNLEELGRVKGIGPKTLGDLAPYVVF